MPRSKLPLVLALFAIAFVIGQLFFIPKTYVNSAVLTALSAPRVWLYSIFTRNDLARQLIDAQLENQSLRAELESARSRPGIITEGRTNYLRAPIYSSYPLNNAGLLLIAAGEAEGVANGMLVLAAPGVFLGEVTKTYARSAEVRTLYDSGWELPVKIGREKIDSLLIGGHEPALTLISKKKPALMGMEVFTAYKQYPYGLLVGELGELTDSDQNLFQEAPLKIPYQIGELNEVYILQQ